jgi:hypothetical protein
MLLDGSISQNGGGFEFLAVNLLELLNQRTTLLRPGFLRVLPS